MKVLLMSLILTLAACSPASIASSLLTGGGPNVNGQIGATNQQGLNVTQAAPSVSLRPKSRVDTIDQSSSGNRVENAETVNNLQGVPLSYFIILGLVGLLGWLTDKPTTIYRNWKNHAS